MKQRPVHLLSLVAVLLFVGTQFGWLPWVHKGGCHPDMILLVSADVESDDPALQFEMGLFPCKFKLLPPGSALSAAKSLQSRVHPYLPCEGLRGRSPPTRLTSYF